MLGIRKFKRAKQGVSTEERKQVDGCELRTELDEKFRGTEGMGRDCWAIEVEDGHKLGRSKQVQHL